MCLGMLPGEHQCGDDDTDDHGDRQVGEHRHHRHQDADEGVGQWDLAEQAEAGPLEGAEHHDKHHADQRCHRDHFDQAGADQDEGEQEQCGGDARRDGHDRRS